MGDGIEDEHGGKFRCGSEIRRRQKVTKRTKASSKGSDPSEENEREREANPGEGLPSPDRSKAWEFEKTFAWIDGIKVNRDHCIFGIPLEVHLGISDLTSRRTDASPHVEFWCEVLVNNDRRPCPSPPNNSRINHDALRGLPSTNTPSKSHQLANPVNRQKAE